MYFRDLEKSLVDGLHLITSGHDVLFMSTCHTRHFVVHLYIMSFGEGGTNENDYEEDDDDRGRVDLNDHWWADKISDDENLFDVNVDEGGVVGGSGDGPSIGLKF